MQLTVCVVLTFVAAVLAVPAPNHHHGGGEGHPAFKDEVVRGCMDKHEVTKEDLKKFWHSGNETQTEMDPKIKCMLVCVADGRHLVKEDGKLDISRLEQIKEEDKKEELKECLGGIVVNVETCEGGEEAVQCLQKAGINLCKGPRHHHHKHHEEE